MLWGASRVGVIALLLLYQDQIDDWHLLHCLHYMTVVCNCLLWAALRENNGMNKAVGVLSSRFISNTKLPPWTSYSPLKHQLRDLP